MSLTHPFFLVCEYIFPSSIETAPKKSELLARATRFIVSMRIRLEIL